MREVMIFLWVSQIHDYINSPILRLSVHVQGLCRLLSRVFLNPNPANTFLTFAPIALLRLALFELFEVALELVPIVLAFADLLGVSLHANVM